MREKQDVVRVADGDINSFHSWFIRRTKLVDRRSMILLLFCFVIFFFYECIVFSVVPTALTAFHLKTNTKARTVPQS